MALRNILSPELTFCNIAGGSKKRLIETSVQLIASQVHQVTANQIYDALITREQLGSTGLGDGSYPSLQNSWLQANHWLSGQTGQAGKF